MANFASLKKTSGNLERLSKEIEKMNSGGDREGDDRFWNVERDKNGNGSAVIRFLPCPAVDGGEDLPWVRFFDHSFKGPDGKWYIENSLTTLNQKDPVSEHNSKLWNSTTDDNSWQRKLARARKRRLRYVSNIYVISDPKHPENEGKVFLFRYGKKIFDKISFLMNPEFEDQVATNPFDFWKGANFKLRIRTVDEYPNYDQSVFDPSSPLLGDDDAMEEIWKKEYSLKEFIDPSKFKSYEELKKRFEEVTGDRLDDEITERKASTPKAEPAARAKPRPRAEELDEEETPPFDVGDDDADLADFKRLALGG